MADVVPASELYEPEFASRWTRYPLHDVADWVNGMAFKDSDFSSSGPPVVKIAEVKNGVTGQTKFTTGEYDPKYFLCDGDMLFCWSGQPETSIGTYRWAGGDGWLNQHIFKVLPNEDLVEDEFLYYLLRYLRPTFIRIARNKQTTGLGHVTKGDLKNLLVALPPRDIQRTVAAEMRVLDNKAESNRRAHALLWAILQSQYDRLALAGRPRPLKEVLSLKYGKALPATVRVPGGVPVYGSSGITGWHDESLIAGPVVIVGRKGSIGEVHWSDSAAFPIDTTFYVEPEGGYPLLACYFALAGAGLQSMDSDSAVPGLNRERALTTTVSLPSHESAVAWGNKSASLLAKALRLTNETSLLERLRDTLLPELLSGRRHRAAV